MPDQSDKNIITREEIDAYVEDNWSSYLEDLQKLVAVNSEEDKSSVAPGAPFGQGPKKAMETALEIAKRMGFTTTDDNGYVGIADYAPKTQPGTPAESGVPTDPSKTVAIMGHVDIVPVGIGWDTDPFTVVEKDGYLFGRGVIDDKGPFLAALYAGKYFVDKGIELPYLLRYIVGSNEETGLEDAEYYTEHYPQPSFLLTPDGDFPVSAGEKGIYEGYFVARGCAGGKLEKVEASTASNVIPKFSVAYVKANAADLPAQEDIEIEDLGDGRAKITATGIPGHAALPDRAKNPSRALFDYLAQNHLYDDSQENFVKLGQLIQSSYRGEQFGLDATDDVFSPLTLVGGYLYQKGDDLIQDLNIRYPKTQNGKELTKKLSQVAEEMGMEYVEEFDMPTYYVGVDSAPIQTLYATFKDHFDDNVEIGTVDGGTYARHFENATAFGPCTPWKLFPSFVGDEHATNEGVSVERLKKVMAIYIDAIQRLMKLSY